MVNPYTPSREAAASVLRAAERLGFDSAWSNSHSAIPATFAPRYPYDESGVPSWNATSPWNDAMTMLAFAAGVTERLRLGTTVIPIITTHALTLAKQAATLDLVSNGRFELGLGAGWLVEEAEVLGHPTDHRQARLEETIDVLRLAWTRPTFSYDGRYISCPEVGVSPRPPQGGRLPIWIGGQGDGVVRIAAEREAGLFIWQQQPERVAEYGRMLRAKRAGAPLAATLFFSAMTKPRREVVREMEAAGVDLLVVGEGRLYEHLDELEAFAREVL